MDRRAYVFGYGSLVAAAPPGVDRRVLPGGFVCDLPGVRRVWGVAMDNSIAVPGYKRYVDDAGRCPAVSVAFLDIVADENDAVNGVCLPVGAGELAALDVRERNYTRIDVRERLGLAAPVWTYVGSPDGRARLHDATATRTAVIDAGYLETVRGGFQALGSAEWAACEPSLSPGALPVRRLRRVDGAATRSRR